MPIIESLWDLQMIENKLLVRPSRANDEYKMADGNVLYLDLSYEKEMHAGTEGVVFKVPEKLHYNSNSGDSLPFDTDIDIQEGDIIFHHYLASQRCIQYGEWVSYQGILFITVSYEHIFAAKRPIKDANGKDTDDFEVIMPNGYILVEPIIEDVPEVNIENFKMPEYMYSRAKGQYGIVKHIGKPIREYHDDPSFDDSSVDIKVGDEVFFERNNDIPLQYEIHRSFEEKKEYFRMQRRDILAKVN